VALRLNQLIPLGQVAQHRKAGGGLDLRSAELQVPRPADTVEDNPGDAQAGIELLVAQHLGGHAAGDLAGIGHQNHRGRQQFGQLGGRAFLG
jgi:hypothetical protein